MPRTTKLKMRSYSGAASRSGNDRCVYVQIRCGRKATRNRFYVGETKRGHAGRYTGYYSTSKDYLLMNEQVELLVIEEGELELIAPRRKALETLIVLEVKARGLGQHLATAQTCDVEDQVVKAELRILEIWARKAADQLEAKFANSGSPSAIINI